MKIQTILVRIWTCGNNFDVNEIYKDPMFNPIAQYEQAYSYYKYLCMQMDYKIKCKEYEKMCKEGIPK